MPSSPEKIAANRRNALKSTGPKTPEGKQRSRRNGLKHGLTGEGIVVPDEDSAAIAERFEAFQADLKPRNDVAVALVQRAALLAVRMERSARHEAAAITHAMLQAEGREADERAEELERLIGLIVDEPAEAARKLRRIPEGIDWMIGRWESLKAALSGPDPLWNSIHCERASELLGHKAVYNKESRLVVLSQAALGHFRLLDERDWPDLADGERREAARIELARLIEGEIARLEGVREGLDHQAIARDRAGAMARALFSASDEAILARKYEAAAERGFFRALKQIERINAQADEADASPPVAEKSEELASPLPAVEEEREEVPKRARKPGPAAPVVLLGPPPDPNSVPFRHPNPFDVQVVSQFELFNKRFSADAPGRPCDNWGMPNHSSKKPKRPRDINQLAKLVVDLATGEPGPEPPVAVPSPQADTPSEALRQAAAELGRRGGLKGGKARAAGMTPERRSEIARKAAAARWVNKEGDQAPD